MNQITKTSLWPFWLGLIAFITGPGVRVIVNLTRPEPDQGAEATNGASAMNVGPLSFILAIVGLVWSIRAFRRGQRSTSLIVGTILSGLTLAYFAYIMVSGLAE